jgi:hypothetical protein
MHGYEVDAQATILGATSPSRPDDLHGIYFGFCQPGGYDDRLYP